MVFTSSVAGSYGLTNHEAIAAAKGGVEAMVRTVCIDLCSTRFASERRSPGLTETHSVLPFSARMRFGKPPWA